MKKVTAQERFSELILRLEGGELIYIADYIKEFNIKLRTFYADLKLAKNHFSKSSGYARDIILSENKTYYELEQ